MANTIKIKSSATASSVPSSLQHGELAINYADGKLFYKNSSNAIVDLIGTSKVIISDTPPSSPVAGNLWFESDTAKFFIYYDSAWIEIGGGGSGGGSSVTVSDTAPASPSEGDLWFESDTALTYVYYDSFWIEIGGSDTYNQIYGLIQAKGDLLIGSASQSISRLGVGANGTKLVADSTQTTGMRWVSDSTNTVIDAKGDLLVGSTSDVVNRLPVGSDNQVLVSNSAATYGVSWQTSIVSSGHSNIYSNSLSTSTATIVSATRTYNGRQYFFSNLTFNMPTNANTDATDWTAPTGGTSKWSYIYIRPTDNKFYISNNAPTIGTNYRTIGGSLVIYMFCAYTSATTMLNFQLDNNRYSISEPGYARSGYRTYENGLGLNYDWGGGNRTTSTYDATAKLPLSATELFIGFRNSYGWRSDSGGTFYYSISFDIQNKSNSWSTVYAEDGYVYCKTPNSTGGYFLRTIHKSIELSLSTNTYNFAATRMTWSHDATTSDADTGAGFWLKGFNDEYIF